MFAAGSLPLEAGSLFRSGHFGCRTVAAAWPLPPEAGHSAVWRGHAHA